MHHIINQVPASPNFGLRDFSLIINIYYGQLVEIQNEGNTFRIQQNEYLAIVEGLKYWLIS